MIEAIEISRSALGYRVVSRPAVPFIRKLYMGRGYLTFVRASGYAAAFAARLECELIDCTGTLSADDCVKLVVAARR